MVFGLLNMLSWVFNNWLVVIGVFMLYTTRFDYTINPDYSFLSREGSYIMGWVALIVGYGKMQVVNFIEDLNKSKEV